MPVCDTRTSHTDSTSMSSPHIEEEEEDLDAFEAEDGVEIGFVEECDPVFLKSAHFPSKIGGKPAWLDYDNLPEPEDLTCSRCGEPLVFLLQSYAGGALPDERCFHRTLFVFCCKNGECHTPGNSPAFKVFRSQLPRKNKYYSFEAPKDDVPAEMTAPIPIQLCNVCGCKGPKRCGGCQSVSYCSKSHQVWDWKHGHSGVCKGKEATEAKSSESALLPEYELVLEFEELPEGKTDEEIQKEFESMASKLEVDTSHDESVNEVETYMADKAKLDATLLKFRDRIRNEPSQVLRYNREGQPLWIGENQPKAGELPACRACGGELVFEMQVMPQIINDIQTDHMDSKAMNFGVLAVYTCKTSCEVPPGTYVQEFLWHNQVNE